MRKKGSFKPGSATPEGAPTETGAFWHERRLSIYSYTYTEGQSLLANRVGGGLRVDDDGLRDRDVRLPCAEPAGGERLAARGEGEREDQHRLVHATSMAKRAASMPVFLPENVSPQMMKFVVYCGQWPFEMWLKGSI